MATIAVDGLSLCCRHLMVVLALPCGDRRRPPAFWGMEARRARALFIALNAFAWFVVSAFSFAMPTQTGPAADQPEKPWPNCTHRARSAQVAGNPHWPTFMTLLQDLGARPEALMSEDVQRLLPFEVELRKVSHMRLVEIGARDRPVWLDDVDGIAAELDILREGWLTLKPSCSSLCILRDDVRNGFRIELEPERLFGGPDVQLRHAHQLRGADFDDWIEENTARSYSSRYWLNSNAALRFYFEGSKCLRDATVSHSKIKP